MAAIPVTSSHRNKSSLPSPSKSPVKDFQFRAPGSESQIPSGAKRLLPAPKATWHIPSSACHTAVSIKPSPSKSPVIAVPLEVGGQSANSGRIECMPLWILRGDRIPRSMAYQMLLASSRMIHRFGSLFLWRAKPGTLHVQSVQQPRFLKSGMKGRMEVKDTNDLRSFSNNRRILLSGECSS